MEVDLKNLTPDIRHLNNMREVIYDKEWLKTADNSELYYMYRAVEEKDKIRYDITIVPSAMLGSEFIKTKGHYHKEGHQEIYTVLEGQAIYLMQKRKNGNPEEIEDVYAVKAEKGDIVIIPPFYGHITINPSETKELKMANWVSPQCESDYSLYEKMQGACYYYLKTGWVKNENYKIVPDLRFEEPSKSLPEDLNFLKQS
ncbi:MAG: glucose-6-phosphate isomerase [Candidatus Staskawiczbacteria bacterium]|nr:glucose-6-phosphate isomerase [Candidatus Staskawiczbacteria bacterium]